MCQKLNEKRKCVVIRKSEIISLPRRTDLRESPVGRTGSEAVASGARPTPAEPLRPQELRVPFPSPMLSSLCPSFCHSPFRPLPTRLVVTQVPAPQATRLLVQQGWPGTEAAVDGPAAGSPGGKDMRAVGLDGPRENRTFFSSFCFPCPAMTQCQSGRLPTAPRSPLPRSAHIPCMLAFLVLALP